MSRARRIGKWVGLGLCVMFIGGMIANSYWTAWIGPVCGCLIGFESQRVYIVHMGARGISLRGYIRRAPSRIGNGAQAGTIDFAIYAQFMSAEGFRTEQASLAMLLPCLGLPTVALWWCDRRRASRGLCPACGYDLCGLGMGVVCPECGAAPAPLNIQIN